MFNHITPPSGGTDHNEQAAEPPHSRRFDERGIALQTIIIMVVLLAIAGAVAAVLFDRASTETQRLDDQTTQVETYAITNATLCRQAGAAWEKTTSMPSSSGATKPLYDALTAAGIVAADLDRTGDDNDGYCKPK